MPAPIVRLGEPPKTLTPQYERLYVYIESGVGSGSFELASWAGHDIHIRQGSGDKIPTATIEVSHAINRETHEDYDGHLFDWQVLPTGSDSAVNAWAVTLCGRRIQVRTARDEPSDDWVLFEGFIRAHEINWTGSGDGLHRASTIDAESTAMAADFELSQKHCGQWRRSLKAERHRLGFDASGENDPLARECVKVGVPMIFNPGGRPNAHHEPLRWAAAQAGPNDARNDVYIPCDPVEQPGSQEYAQLDEPRPFTVARILRYIQWAAMQPPPVNDDTAPADQYDRLYTSDPLSVADLQDAGRWTTYDLKWNNLDSLIGPYLANDAPPTHSSSPRTRALQQMLPDVCIEAMSTLEALAYVCDRAGILFHVEVVAGQRTSSGGGSAGKALTRVVFSIRGDVQDHEVPHGSPPSGSENTGFDGFEPGGQPMDPSQAQPGSRSRLIYLYVPSDRIPGVADNTTDAQKLAAFNAGEGSIGLDESGARNGVYLYGAPATFEGEWRCVPGWLPDSMWDVDTASPGAVAAAQAAVGNQTWLERYASDDPQVIRQYGKVGRLWVLNEHGGYRPTTTVEGVPTPLYKRTAGPWSTDAAWAPYDFAAASQGNVFELVHRGQSGWSTRRRQFLPCRALIGEKPLDCRLLMSWDSGSTWRFIDTKLDPHQSPSECAIYLSGNLLDQAFTLGTVSYPRAYIAGTLRLAVLAEIQGDDYVVGLSVPNRNKQWNQLSAWDLSRRDQYKRQLRLRPGQARVSAANASHLFGATDDVSYMQPGNRDDSAVAQADAERLGAELGLRRHNGQVTIPWLHRDGAAAYPGYRIGDEILGIKSGVPANDVPLLGYRGDVSTPSPRVIGIEYVYRSEPDEQSTTIIIEDAVYAAESTIPKGGAAEDFA